MAPFLARIADAAWFQNFIIGVILLAGVVVGLETYPDIVHAHGPLLHTLDAVILGIFVAEIAIKMGAHGRRPWRYFLDPWNVFDFVIVVACFMPFLVQYAMVLRMLRLLRVLRLVRAIPRLQILVNALLKSIPSMFYVSILLTLVFYIYAVAATFLFSTNDPFHFGNLQLSLLSLFRAVTLEDWTDLMYIQMYGCDAYPIDGGEHLCTNPKAMPVVGSLFFVSFVLLGTMIVLNLFIGVIVNGMDEAQKEEELDRLRSQHVPPPTLQDELGRMEALLDDIQGQIARVRKAAEDQAKTEHRLRAPGQNSAPTSRGE
ncbi:MAG: ion transporter [Deltaproteobacteria bacterium]|nr:MAG: ion transporter [Deltaproteobacteria bacterium]